MGPEVRLIELLYPANDSIQLLQMILLDLGIKTSRANLDILRAELREHLIKLQSEGRKVILVIDEAQNLISDVLREIYKLSEFETEGRHLIRVILVGLVEVQENRSSLKGVDL